MDLETELRNKRAKAKYYYRLKQARAQGLTLPDYDTWLESSIETGEDPREPNRNSRTRDPLWYARTRYSRHYAQAKYRKIGWEFDFDSWYLWWQGHGIDRNIPDSERGAQRLCMCRWGDTGPYSPRNVYLGTHSMNASDAARFGRNRGGRPKGSKNKPKG